MRSSPVPVFPKRVLQITDTHLFSDPERRLKGIDTWESLRKVAHVAMGHWSGIVPDLVLLTGDLAHDERASTYRLLADEVAAWNVPVRTIPGNHDDRACLKRFFPGDPIVDLSVWRVVMLDTQKTGSVEGFLAQDQLQLLQSACDEAKGRPLLVCVHHHPRDIGSIWMDGIRLQNSDALFDIVDRSSSSVVIVNGHIHQERVGQHGNIPIYGTPSTNVQFTPETDGAEYDEREPGYRWLELNEDGTHQTGVVRVQGTLQHLSRQAGY